MAQTRSRIWLEVAAVVVTLAIGAVLMYALLPFVTAPDQVIVPPPRDMDPAQTFLTLFVAATAIGAPVTVGIVLALLFRFVSKRVPASSTVAPDIPSPRPAPRAAESPKEMPAKQARAWKIVATLLVLVVAALGLMGLASIFAQYYK